MSKLLPALLAVALSAAAAPSSRGPSPVTPLFDLESPEGSPFPSDRFTVADSSQFTGRRVNLPMPGDCAVNVSECEDRTVLNQLDGFNMQPRISIPFSGSLSAEARRAWAEARGRRRRADFARGYCTATGGKLLTASPSESNVSNKVTSRVIDSRS